MKAFLLRRKRGRPEDLDSDSYLGLFGFIYSFERFADSLWIIESMKGDYEG